MDNNIMKWHEHYKSLSIDERRTIDDAFAAVINVFQDHSIKCSYDDRAEELISAITKYLIESRKD